MITLPGSRWRDLHLMLGQTIIRRQMQISKMVKTGNCLSALRLTTTGCPGGACQQRLFGVKKTIPPLVYL